MNDLPANSNPDHDDLLDRLVAEFTERIRSNETPSIVEYQDKYPHLKDEIHELLSSVAMIEGLKKQSGSLAESGRKPFDDLINLQRLGEYRIVRELGRGGMGVVLEAVHESLGRKVAIKVLPHRMVDNEKNVERFTREARAAATLHHNNIVSVFGVGQSDGYYYYVMEYVDGHGLDQVMRSMKANTQRQPNATLVNPTIMMESGSDRRNINPNTRANATKIDSQTLSPGNHQNETEEDETEEDFKLNSSCRPEGPTRSIDAQCLPKGDERFRWAARIIADIADALDYAHSQGVLHRDIKPGNLLLDPAGRVWLTDFGLVKNIANQTMTMAGDIIGTPQYMAPESFEARYEVASETYCLGATLYELVTLQPVCEQGSAAEMIRRVTTESPVAPRKIDPRIPADLSTIIDKSLDRETDQRYQTAAALRDDLRAFLDDRPIMAKRASIAKRTRLWCKRNPWQTISAALMGLVALLATAGYLERSRSFEIVSDQNELLIEEKEKTQRALTEAKNNARKFRQQYQRADANVDISMEMFDELFKQMVFRGTGQKENFTFDGFRELSGIETTISTEDAKYLQEMLGYVRQLANNNSESVELAAEAAKSFRRVANIYHLLAENDEARKAYQRAIKLYEKLNQTVPTLGSSLAQAQTANEMGLLNISNGSYRAGVAIFKRVIKEIDASSFSDELSMQLELIKTLNLIGISSPVESTDALVRERGSEPQGGRPNSRRRGFRKRRPRSIRQLSNENLRYVSEAIERVDKLIEKHTDSPELLPELVLERAKSRLRLAELQYVLERKTDSLESKALAVQDLESNLQLSDRAEYQAVLAQAYAMPIGQDTQSAVQQLKKAREISSVLCEAYPGSSDYLQLDAEIHYQLGQLSREIEQTTQAIDYYQTAMLALDEVSQLLPRNPVIAGRTNDLAVELADLLIREKMFVEGKDVLLNNLRRLERARTTGGRTSIPGRSRALRQYSMLAKCFQELGDANNSQRYSGLAEEARKKQIERSEVEHRNRRPDRPKRGPGNGKGKGMGKGN